jgi:hypothetical protein
MHREKTKMIWPEQTHLEAAVEHPGIGIEAKYLGELVIRKPFGQDEITDSEQNMVSLGCSMADGIVDAELIYDPESPFMKLGFITMPLEERTALREISTAAIQELVRIGFVAVQLELEAGHLVDKDKLTYEQDQEPELDLDITNERYEHPDAKIIFQEAISIATTPDVFDFDKASEDFDFYEQPESD